CGRVRGSASGRSGGGWRNRGRCTSRRTRRIRCRRSTPRPGRRRPPRTSGCGCRRALRRSLRRRRAALPACGNGSACGCQALPRDAGLVLADAAGIGLSRFALRIAGRPADAKRTYGYYRLEILAALVNGAVLFAIAAGIAAEGYRRLMHPVPVQVQTMVTLACLGIALNAVGMWITHGIAQGSMNLRATFLHLAGDLLNSIGVLVSALLIAWTGQLAADPIVSFLIAATIVWSAIRLCRDAVDVLLEGAPRHIPVAEVSSAIENVPGVAAVHDLHVWTITSGLIALSCHLVV